MAINYYELRNQDSLKHCSFHCGRLPAIPRFDQSPLRHGNRFRRVRRPGCDATRRHQSPRYGSGVLAAEYEHAIALLVGQPASSFEIPAGELRAIPPEIPYGVPSQLLERRPDIAAAERSMSQANAQIGIATAAFYPTISLSGAAGLESTSITNWFTWPSRFWSVGPALAEALFDAGLRKATVQQFRSAYDQQVANYREPCHRLSAGRRQSGLSRIISTEIQQQDTAVKEQYVTSRYNALLLHSRILLLNFGGEDPERGEIVFDLLKGGQNGLAIVGQLLIVGGTELLDGGPAQSAVEKCFRQGRPTDQKRLGQVNQVVIEDFQSRRGAQGNRGIEGGGGNTDLGVGLGHCVRPRQYPGGAREAATARQRESPAAWPSVAGIGERRGRLADQKSDGVFVLRAENADGGSLRLGGFELRFRLRDGLVGIDSGVVEGLVRSSDCW